MIRLLLCMSLQSAFAWYVTPAIAEPWDMVSLIAFSAVVLLPLFVRLRVRGRPWI